MEKKLFRSYQWLIVFALTLVVVVVKIDVIYAGARVILGLLSPFFIGFVIAFVLNIPYNAMLERLTYIFRGTRFKRLARPLALVGAYALCALIIGGIVSFIIPELINSVTRLINNIGFYISNLERIIYQLGDHFQVQNLDLSKLEQEIKSVINGMMAMATGLVPQIFNFTASILQTMINSVLGVILSVYMLSGRDTLRMQVTKLLHAFLPPKIARKTLQIGRLTSQCFAKFISGQLTEACILGALCFVGMSVFKFDYAFLISIIIAFTSIIPVVGAFIGAVPGIFLLLMVDPRQALWFIVFLVVLQQIEGNLIYPRVVGDSIGLPAIWVMLAILLGGGLGGPLGMLLGVPIATVLYKLLKQEAAIRLERRSEQL